MNVIMMFAIGVLAWLLGYVHAKHDYKPCEECKSAENPRATPAAVIVATLPRLRHPESRRVKR